MEMKKTYRISAMLVAIVFYATAVAGQPFSGEKSSWHGFDRYDFTIDMKTLAITPISKSDAEGTGVAEPAPGTKRGIVVVPKKAAAGSPWTWRGCYWDHEPQTEIELLQRGFHVVFITTDPDATWDAWYEFVVEEYGLSSKTAFIGMSRGGSNAYTWGGANPDKVFAIYADNPAIPAASLNKLHLLAEQDVPLLNICGSTDPILQNTRNIESVYHAAGGRISVLLKDGPAHHPHSMRSPEIAADFIERSFAELSAQAMPPSWLPERYTRGWFSGTIPVYGYIESEKVWASTWGPEFGGAYRNYNVNTPELGRVSIYTPKSPAVGVPWVWRANFPKRISSVDLALLADGFHIVVGPVPTNQDGPSMEQWDKCYEWFTERGFSEKPVMSGDGAATGEVYVWAERNPDCISGIYGENPIMRASIAPVQPMDNLAPLAKSSVPILHVCGGLDPNLESQTRETERRYRALGGELTVIVDEGKGHYPLSPMAPAPVVDMISGWVR
jgi:hypothetical protein